MKSFFIHMIYVVIATLLIGCGGSGNTTKTTPPQDQNTTSQIKPEVDLHENSDGTLTFEGKAKKGALITVLYPDGTKQTHTVTNSDGSYSFTSATSAMSGDIDVETRLSDGSLFNEETIKFKDSTKPVVPKVNTPKVDQANLVTVSGTAEPLSTVFVTFPDGNTQETKADKTGNFTLVSNDSQQNGSIQVKVKDRSGNISESTQTSLTGIQVPTKNKPVITLNGEKTTELNIGDSFSDAGATASDTEDGDITKSIKTKGSVDTSKAGTYTITYSVTDSDSNTVSTTRTVTVKTNDKPVITLKGDNPLALKVGDPFKDSGAKAFDTEDGDLTTKVKVKKAEPVDTNKVGTYTITYSVTDSDGNTVSTTRTVTVKSNDKPVITLNGEKTTELNIGDSFSDAGATASDTEDGDITKSIKTKGSVDTSKAGTYTITYSVTDSDGNTVSTTRTVTVKSNDKPVITLNGDNPLMLGTTPLYKDIEPGATALDTEDGDISNKITIIDRVTSQVPGTYTVTYNVTDSDGNTVTKDRTVIITESNQRPQISLKGKNPLVLQLGDTYVEAGVTANDNEDGDITAKVKTTGSVDTNKVGTYTITYSVTDSGNITREVTRTVTVQKDTTKPTIILKGQSTVTIKLGEMYHELGATAQDSKDGDLTTKIKTTGSVDINKAGTYTITYSVTDSDTNTASISRTVIVQSNSTGALTGVASGINIKHIGSGVGGAMFAIAFHPTNPNNIFISGDMGLVYHTTNGGQSWKTIPGLYKVRFMQFDPKNPNIVWAGGGRGIFKSTDGGLHWKYTFNFKNDAKPSLGAMALDPTDTNIIYVAEGFAPSLSISWVKGRVWKSTDGGSSWKELPRPNYDYASDSIKARNYTTILIDKNSPFIQGKGHSKVYLAGKEGFYRHDNAGEEKNWQRLNGYLFDEGQGGNMVAVDNNGKTILFCTVIPAKGHNKKGVYRSDDDGMHWQGKNTNLGNIIGRLEIRNKNIHNESIHALLLAHSPANPKRLYVGSWQGIAVSDDLGETWTQTIRPEVGYLKHADGNSYEMPTKDRQANFPHSYLGGIDNFIRITASPSNANVVAFADNLDVQFSQDGSKTWNSRSFDYGSRYVDPDLIIPNAPADTPKNRYTHLIKSRGIQSTVNTDVAIDPFDSKIYYATYMDIGLQISRDGGKTWEHPSNGLPPRGHTWSVVVDPTKEGRLWVSIREGGAIYKSDDKGLTWTSVSIIDTSVGKVADLALDTTSYVNSRTLYAATEDKGIYKSTNGGASWAPVLNKPSFDVKIDPSNPSVLYAGTKDGLYKTNNKGANWTRIASGQLGKTYRISVSKNNTLYVTTNDPGKSGYWDPRKLWRSDNGGQSFNQITPRFMKYIGAVAVNPKDPNYIYISNFNVEQAEPSQKMIMARSKDGGHTWEEIGGADFAFAMGSDIHIDPKNSQHILFNSWFSLIEAFDTQAP